MTLEIVIAFVTFVFIGSVTPGPNNLMLMSSGINFGLIKTIPHLLGIVIGLTIMLLLIAVGLAPVFDAFPVIYVILKAVSIVYLTFLSWRIATSNPLDSRNKKRQIKPISFIQAALFQWVNPKAWIMSVTTISIYMPSLELFYNIFGVVIIFSFVVMPAIFIWAFLGTQLQCFLNNSKKTKIFNMATALLLMLSMLPILF